jgi:hypothetical protein
LPWHGNDAARTARRRSAQGNGHVAETAALAACNDCPNRNPDIAPLGLVLLSLSNRQACGKRGAWVEVGRCDVTVGQKTRQRSFMFEVFELGAVGLPRVFRPSNLTLFSNLPYVAER